MKNQFCHVSLDKNCCYLKRISEKTSTYFYVIAVMFLYKIWFTMCCKSKQDLDDLRGFKRSLRALFRHDREEIIMSDTALSFPGNDLSDVQELARRVSRGTSLPGSSYIFRKQSNVRRYTNNSNAEAKAKSSNSLVNVTKKIGRLTKFVDQNWEELTEQQKESLKLFAYDILEKPKGLEAIKIGALAFVVSVAIKITQQEKQIQRFGEKIDDLIDTILTKIEEDDPIYQETLSNTLEELKVTRRIE